MYKALMIEDHKEVRDFVKEYFDHKEIEVIEAQNGYEGLAILDDTIDIILLDIMMPGIDGYEVCKQIRSQYNTLIVFISALSEDENQLKAYEYGADDYITKPFKPSLLYAKCLALLKRNKKIETNQLQSGKVILDLDKHILVIEENNIVLTDKEFKLLRYLMENQGIVLSRDKIMDQVWGFEYEGESRTVDMHIKTLRQKLGAAGSCIKTVRNVGYMIE